MSLFCYVSYFPRNIYLPSVKHVRYINNFKLIMIPYFLNTQVKSGFVMYYELGQKNKEFGT